MKTRSLVWAVAIAAIAPFALASPRAAADTITLNFDGGGITQKIGLDGSTFNVTGGPFSWNVASAPPNLFCFECGGSVTSWCVELTQSIASTTTYTLTSVNSLPNSTTIKNLFAEGYKNGEPTGTAAAAFQLALWDLVFDSSAGSVSSGNFQYKGSSTTTKNEANSLLAKAIADTTNGIDAFSQYLSGYSLYLLDNKYKQNQLVLVPDCKEVPPPNSSVPAPPAALLAVFGVIALGGRASWFRKKAVKA